jgi:hypothetical protein
MAPESAADAESGGRAGADDNDDHYPAERRDNLSGRIAFRRMDEAEGEKQPVAYAKGMFILMRATSVSCTWADFAMWRFSLPLFDESK